eukprot:scaffold3027_cov92-Skeletonema_dohrnii-CCMP3373.AAC.1
MLTQPDDTSTNNKPPLLRNIQAVVDNGGTPSVPVVWRLLPQTNGEAKVDVLGCLIKDGDEVTLGSNRNPEKDPVGITLAHKVTSDGNPIHISHHACSIKRRDDEDKACLWIKGSETQEESKRGRRTTKLKAVQYIWGKDGEIDQRVEISRLWQGSSKKSVVSKLDPSRRTIHTTCIEVTYDNEILDQIFIGVHPQWKPTFKKYNFDDDNWYQIPPGMEGVSPQEVEDSRQLTQESVGSLPPNVTVQFSQLSVQEEEDEEKKTNPIFRNGLGDDPVKMLSRTSEDDDDDTQLPNKPSQGADLEIFKIMRLPSEDDSVNPEENAKDRGSLYEVAAGFLDLKSVKQYDTAHGQLFRQRHKSSQGLHTVNPYGDLLARIKSEANVEFGSEGDYFIGSSTQDVRALALRLAPSYEEEFIALFGSKKEYRKQLRKLKSNDVDCESLPMMITVIARALLCAVVLYLPDKADPLYFYPYPMDSGTPSPQHGDYQRPMMTLTLWTDGTLSLLMPIGYDEVHVDTTKSRIREKSQGRKQANQSKAKKIKLSIGHLFEKNGIHYVEKFGTKFTQPRLSVLTYYEDEEVSLADIIAEVNQMMPAMREHVRSKYPKVEGTIYDFADIEQDVADKGFLRYRRNAPDVPSRNPVYYMSSGLDLPSSDHFKVDPSLTEGGDRPHVSYESATDYRNESIRRVHDLTNNELKDKMKSSGMEGFLDAPDPVQFKTMRTAAGKIDLWHSTGMQVSNGQLQVLDVHYIRCIDDDWGPYKGEANSGAQISGEDWYNELTVVEQKYVRALHLKYCHLPPWMISPSMHRAVSKHFTKKEDLHSQCIYGGPSFVTKEVGFSAVGGNIQGCEQLGKAFLPYRVDDIVEVKYDNYETFLLESGCTLTKVLEGGKFCVPAEVHIKEEDKTRQERHEEIVKEVLAKAKARSKSSGKKHKPKKRASSGKKKGAKSQDDIDDLSEEEIPEPKECAPAKKAAASGKKKRQADSDSYYDNQLMGTQSSKAPARATASRARSTAKKP